MNHDQRVYCTYIVLYMCLGSIRCGTVSPDGNWLALGFASGMVSVLETRTGLLLLTHKAHEGEILQVC